MARRLFIALLLLLPALIPALAFAQGLPIVNVVSGKGGVQSYSLTLQLLALMTVLTLLPSMLLMMTSFVRIIIVFSILRQALGTGQTPPNQVLAGLALFLTLFIMQPVMMDVYNNAILPYMNQGMPFEEALAAADRLRPFVTNTVVFLHEVTQRGGNILFEGAQGTFLDIDHGTYPFVTSSNTTSGGACTGSGVPPNRMDKVIGVLKAYTTRVGGGPLPTESAEVSDLLHGMGREFGSTTGRARRCGWFDAVATRHATMVNVIDELAITNIDGLDSLKTLQVCVAYRANGQTLRHFPADHDILAQCEPVYETFPGWQTSTEEVTRWEDLPVNCRNYLLAISQMTGARLTIASVGPARAQTMFL